MAVASSAPLRELFPGRSIEERVRLAQRAFPFGVVSFAARERGAVEQEERRERGTGLGDEPLGIVKGGAAHSSQNLAPARFSC